MAGRCGDAIDDQLGDPKRCDRYDRADNPQNEIGYSKPWARLPNEPDGSGR